MQKKLVLGLDVGIASVGWGLIDLETSEVVDCGVRLFEEGTAKNNEERRGFRSGRRLIRRKRTRIEAMKDLLKRNGYIDEEFQYSKNIYELRTRGLKHKLNNNEFANCILHITKKRGLVDSDIIPENEQEIKDSETSKKSLSENQKYLSQNNYFVCELQLKRLNDGKLKGNQNIFTTDDYIKEIKQLCLTNEISNELTEEIIEIVKRKRKYYEGPGGPNSPTPYGRYAYIGAEPIDLIEKMRGKCSIYLEEKRAPQKSYSAQLFNFLNDLNNLKFDGDQQLSQNQKEEIIYNFIDKKAKITPKELAKFLDLPLEEISGFRLNKKSEPILTEFDGYKVFIDLVKKEGFSEKILNDKKIIDEISEILTMKKGQNERIEAIKKIKNIDIKIFDQNVIERISTLNGFSTYHSLSFRAIYEMLPDLLETNNNQMQIISLNGYKQLNKDVIGKTIPSNIEDVLSPVVRRSQNETIKIINAVRKKYGELDSIVIEMPRDKNSLEQKNRINKLQKNNEEINLQVLDEISKKYKGKINIEIKQKVRLYLEQDGVCIYSGKSINLNDLIENPYIYEIDHIIPLSISLDDSFKNKCLVYREENQEKGQKSPYQYLSKIGKYDQFKNRVINLNKNGKIDYRKMKNYLNESDINKFSVRKDFINRNLVDTRYASRNILNLLSEYYNQNNIDTKVYTIKGIVTNYFRKQSNLPKVREEDNSHHAIDALLIAGIKKLNFFDDLIKISRVDKLLVNDETGEIIKPEDIKIKNDSQYLNFINNLDKLNVKFSQKVDKKFNKGLSDQTIYSVRIKPEDQKEYIISKKNIYDDNAVANWFKEDNLDKLKNLFMFKYDVESFNLLKKITQEYSYAENPFLEYKLKHGDFIRKKSKKGNGPKIETVKYYESKLGNHLDISHKYNTENKVVLLSLNPYRIDIYRNETNENIIIQIYQHEIKNKDGKYYIDENDYKDMLQKRGINNNCKFLFSVYKNEPLFVGKVEESTYKGVVLYSGVQNLESNIISYKIPNEKKVYKNGKVQPQPYINIKKNINIQKMAFDVLGNMYKLPFENEPKLLLN